MHGTDSTTPALQISRPAPAVERNLAGFARCERQASGCSGREVVVGEAVVVNGERGSENMMASQHSATLPLPSTTCR